MKKYEVKVWETKSDLSSYGNSFYLDLECDKAVLSEVIKEVKEYIEGTLPYAVDIIEIQIDPKTFEEIREETILAWEIDPLEKIKWNFEGITEDEYNEMMTEEQEEI